MNKRNVYTTGQLARIFRVSTGVIRRWIDTEQLKAFRQPGKRDRKVRHEDLEAFADKLDFRLEWDDPQAEPQAVKPLPPFAVGDKVMWMSKAGPVEVEYRGKHRARTGDWVACIIVRNPGEALYQTIVPLEELWGGEEQAERFVLRKCLDTDAIEGFLAEAVEHYATSAPTVADHLDDLYMRFKGDGSEVTLLELVGVLRLREEGEWEHPNYAANRIYKLRDRLGMDTTGQVGF
jgi:hypothetical protein